MAAMTCAGPRAGAAWVARINWAGSTAGKGLRRAAGTVRRWLLAFGRPHDAPKGGGRPPEQEKRATHRPSAASPARGQAQAFGDLLACMSHELRTPLNAVIGFSDVMERELFGPLGDTRYQEYARHIRDSGDALLRAAEDALAMTTLVASASHSSADRLTLAGLVETAWDEVVARTGGRGVRLELVVAGDLEVRANARAIRQALIHLLAAGLIRAQPGTALRISAIAVHGRVRIEVSASDITPAAPEGDDLALCLARTLLEVQGSALTAQRCPRSWIARTELEHAVQEDLFAHAS